MSNIKQNNKSSINFQTIKNKNPKMDKINVFFWQKLEKDLATSVPNYVKNGFQ